VIDPELLRHRGDRRPFRWILAAVPLHHPQGRFLISAGYLPCRVMAPSSQGMESPVFPGRFTARPERALSGPWLGSAVGICPSTR
jgi:hypothetical protein